MADPQDPFAQNILGVTDLVQNKVNKVREGGTYGGPEVAHDHFVDARQATNDKAIDFAAKLIKTHLQRARESGIVEGENKIVKAMAPYTIQADPKQYCATFTHGQFAGVVREKQRERLEAAQQGKE